jgi:hypothetical protein
MLLSAVKTTWPAYNLIRILISPSCDESHVCNILEVGSYLRESTSPLKTSWLMIFRKGPSENQTGLCVPYVVLCNVKTSGTCSYHCHVKG